MAGIPVLAAYLARTLLQPLLLTDSHTDLYLFYLPPARLLARGLDPYAACGGSCFAQLSSAASLYPPLVVWLFQPVAFAGFRAVDAVAVLLSQVCVAAILWALLASPPRRDPQLRVLMAVAALSYPPLLNLVHERQLHLLVVLAAAAWLAGWVRGDRWWAGVALGVAAAVKLVVAPLFALAAWGRRRLAAGAGILVWLGLWLIAEPRLLPEYLIRVLPAAAAGTGSAKNVAPIATVARLLHPDSLSGAGSTGVDTTVRIAAALIALAAIAITAGALARRPRTGARARALEVAVVVAVLPLLTTYVLPGHLAIELIPIAVLTEIAIAVRSWRVGVAAAAGWVLTGPLYLAFTNSVDLGHITPLDRAWAETALTGVVLVWAACACCLRSARVREDEGEQVPPEVPEDAQSGQQEQPAHETYNAAGAALTRGC